jgi:hypothetical protein
MAAHAGRMTSTATHRAHRARRRPRSRSATEVALLWLEGLLAFGAFGGAAAFLALGDDLLGEATARLPLGSPVLAGVALALVNGVLPTTVLLGALRRRRWARRGHLVVGTALTLWIVVQVALLGWPPVALQWIYLGWGVLIVALATRLPPVLGASTPVGAPSRSV